MNFNHQVQLTQNSGDGSSSTISRHRKYMSANEQYFSSRNGTNPSSGQLYTSSTNESMNYKGCSSKLQSMKQAFHDSIDKSMFGAYIPVKINQTPRNRIYSDDYGDLPSSRVINKDRDTAKIEQVTTDLKDNLELFNLDMKNNLNKLRRGQQKLKLANLSEELGNVKSTLTQTIEKTNGKRIETLEKLLGEFKNIRNEIGKDMVSQVHNTTSAINHLSSNIQRFQDEMHTKLTQVEEQQRRQNEHIKAILYNSDNEMVQMIAKKILSTESREELEKVKDSYIAPDMHDLSLLTQKMRRTTIDIDLKMITFVKQQKEKNSMIQEVIENDEEENLTEFQKQANELPFEDTVKLKRRSEYKKTIPLITHKILNCDWKNYKLQKRNKLRSYVHVIIAQLRLGWARKEVISLITFESLKFFADNFLIVDDYLQNWIKVSTKKAFTAITNFTSLNLDPTDNDPLYAKEKFVKLQIRLKWFIEQLEENTNETKINSDLISFFKCILTDSCVPFKFFSLFELSRLSITDMEIKNVNQNQKVMIVLMYILVKLFIKNLILEKTLPHIKNPQARKNIKAIASIYYHTILEYLREKCPVINDISKKEALIDRQEKFQQETVGNKKEEMERLSTRGKEIDKSYKVAVSKYYENRKSKRSSEAKIKKERENQLFVTINAKIPELSPDEDINEIQAILLNVYSLSDLSGYFSMARHNNFDLMEAILSWVGKVLKLICE